MSQRVFIITFLLLGSVLGSRVRRHLVFTEGSRVFFSVNVRDNLFNYSDFFAEVFGFKIDWELPSNLVDSTKKRIQRRDLYQGLEKFLHWQNLNGTSCIRKFLCEAAIILPRSNHFLAQFYAVIFSSKSENNKYFSEISNKTCTKMLKKPTENECPLSLIPVFFRSESDF